jgi:hypothetical protein
MGEGEEVTLAGRSVAKTVGNITIGLVITLIANALWAFHKEPAANGSSIPPKDPAIPNPLTVVHEPTALDDQRYAEERKARAEQLKAAQHLNIITGTAAVVGFLSLVGLIISIQQSRHALAIDQRAWVMLENLSGNMEVGKPYLVSVLFKNFGKTPAQNATLKARMEPLSSGTLPSFANLQATNLRFDAAPGGQASTIIRPDSGEPVVLENLLQMTNGQSTEYVFGRVDYEDIFSVHHWSQFCYYLERDARSYSLCPGDSNKTDRDGE